MRSRSATVARRLWPIVAPEAKPTSTVTWSASATEPRMSWMPRRIVAGVMPFASLNAFCFWRLRSVSSIARAIEPVTVSA
jgi:hypothetical protein